MSFVVVETYIIIICKRKSIIKRKSVFNCDNSCPRFDPAPAGDDLCNWCSYHCFSTGNETVIVVPFPISLCTSMLPPYCLIMFLMMKVVFVKFNFITCFMISKWKIYLVLESRSFDRHLSLAKLFILYFF